MKRLYDPQLTTHSTPGEDLKWSSCVLGIIGLVVALIAAAVSALL